MNKQTKPSFLLAVTSLKGSEAISNLVYQQKKEGYVKPAKIRWNL
jgi:hypothetical protein